MIKKLKIGEKSGVEQAACDFGKELGIPCEKSYDVYRTIKKTDGTLVIAADEILGETAKLIESINQSKKPCLIVDLNHYPSPQIVVDWIETHSIKKLHVTGPDEQTLPGIYAIAYEFLVAVFYAFPQT